MSNTSANRLVLEPVRPEHSDRLRAMRATPEVRRRWDAPPDGWPLAPEPGQQRMSVLLDGEVIGYIQVWEEPDPDERYAEVDIFLAPERHDRGLGTEAMREVIRYLTEERGHHRVTLSAAVDNARAIRCYEKAGFRRVGVTRKASRSHLTGEWEDELLMEYVI